MAKAAQSSRSNRVDTIDFWRGLVLIAILCDHVPGNLIEKVTPRNFGLSDSAEAFVFLSGVSVALAHYGRALRGDWRDLVTRCFGRAFRIYGVHIGLTCVALAIPAIAYVIWGQPGLIATDGRNYIFHQPLQGALGVLMLTQQLGYFNILPMYVLFLLWSPAVLTLTRVSPWLALVVSVAIYVTVRAFGVALPNWPESGTWFFNPFAWQLVFTLGIVAGVWWRDRPIPHSRILYGVAAAALLLSAFAVTDGFWQAPGLHDRVFSTLDVFKANLGSGRLIYFVALAYFVAQTPIAAAECSSLGRELQRLGRHSLPIFALGSISSCAGQTVLQVASVHFSGSVWLFGLIYTIFGILGLFLFARYLERQGSGHSWQVVLAGRSLAVLRPAFAWASLSLSHLVQFPRH